MLEISNDLKRILELIVVVAGILVVISWISFFILMLLSRDISDQTGWRNFSKPFIGVGVFSITVLFVILIVFVLLGII